MRGLDRYFRFALVFVFVVFSASLAEAKEGCKGVFGKGAHKFSLATGSPGELGLLEELAKAFNKEHGTSVCWKKAGVNPSGAWYVITKDFMMATLKRADKEKGYFMTDSSTWVAGKKDLANLAVLFRGDPYLINTYHGLCQPKGATPAQTYAAKFINFLSSEDGQRIIRDYGKKLYGEGMYNDAVYAKKYDH